MIRCIAVDDEPLALDIIEEYISRVPFLTLTGKCSNGFQAMELLQKEPADLIFLDIHMPDISGIQFLKGLQYRPPVIFTTAHENYAMQGFDLDAVDYLLKPIPYERFLKAVNKAQEYFNYRNKPAAGPATGASTLEYDYLFVRADYKILKINFRDIRYIEGLKDYIKIFAGDRPILTLQSLKSIEEKLPSRDFMRVHRSFIVSLPKIDSIQKNRIMIGNSEIPIGDLYREQFFERINEKH
jgi:two-component system LytT family response regulator